MDRRLFLAGSAGTAALFAAGPGTALAQVGSGDAALVQLMDRIFYEGLLLSPESATSLGLDKGSRAPLRSRLSDRGEGGRAAKRGFSTWAEGALRQVDPATLSPSRRLQREIALFNLDDDLAPSRVNLESVRRPYPIFHQGGAYFQIPDFLDSSHSIETATDAEAYVDRLEAFPFMLDDEAAYQAELARRGVVAPRWSLELTIGQMRQLRAPVPMDNTMVRSLARRVAAKGLDAGLVTDAARVVETKVYPALDRQIALMTRLAKTTRPGDGVWRLNDGAEIYRLALASSTTTAMTPEEVHRIGLRQVAELSAQLTSVLDQAGFPAGPIGKRLAALNVAPDQLYPETDAGRAALLASLNEGVAGMRPRLARAFRDIPEIPLEIRRVPPEIQDGASNGYYYRAPLDGSRPAIYWINLKRTSDWPKYGLPSLTYHEGIPGHHLQNGYAQKATDLPRLLSTQFISSYGEGWALYSEQLADELGAYSGIEKAGYLQSFLFRAARLVVDTGIHSKRWTRERATQYFVDNVGFAQGRSASEVNRYCTQPGQACSYKIGHNKWLELRSRAEARLGAKFSLPWFHDVLKDGLMPLALLEKRVDERIAEALRG